MQKEQEFNVDLIGYTQQSSYVFVKNEYEFDTFGVAGALGCFSTKSSYEILNDLNSIYLDSDEKLTNKLEKIASETSGRGHGSVLDQGNFIFSIENVPRIVTMHLSCLEYCSILQQSLRRVTVKPNFHIPETIKSSNYRESYESLCYKAFSMYEKMINSGIPKEDARYVLPISIKTNLQFQINPRELMHLDYITNYQDKTFVKVPKIIKEVVNSMVEEARLVSPIIMKYRKNNYIPQAWRPAAFLFSTKKSVHRFLNRLELRKNDLYLIHHSWVSLGESDIEYAIYDGFEEDLSYLKHVHFTFLAVVSLSTLHQILRQRTWNHCCESIYCASYYGEIYTPQSILKDNSIFQEYFDICTDMLSLYRMLLREKVPVEDAVCIVPNSVKIGDFIHIDGWNCIHGIAKRLCFKSQDEIRQMCLKIVEKIKNVRPVLGKYLQPQGVIYGRCPEDKNCGYCSTIISSK